MDDAARLTAAADAVARPPSGGPTAHRPVVRPPALVATDLDGTLLRSDGSVSARTVAALAGVAALGIETVLVTARPPRWLHDLEHVVGSHGIALCANGAFVYDVAGRTILSSRTIATDVLGEVAADLRRALPGVAFASESATGLALEAVFRARREFIEPDVLWCETIEEVVHAPVGKLLARSRAIEHDAFLGLVRDVVGDRLLVSNSGARGLAEMSAPGVTKAAALADWTAQRAVAQRDVWAFGDMPNDLPMLEWAGTSFAVANAHPDVRAVATHTCPSNDDDGVAQVLETLLA